MIDEAHHLQASEEDTNRLGKAIDDILDTDDPTSKVILSGWT